VQLSEIYAAVERDYPHLVDSEVEPPPSNAVRRKHELRWNWKLWSSPGLSAAGRTWAALYTVVDGNDEALAPTRQTV
jgi:hypothetical protein